jgi:hypothetical protein
VLRDRCRVREISLIDFPLPRCSRRIRPIFSTTSIPTHRPLRAKAGSRPNRKSGGQFWTPMTPLRGSILHAETHYSSQGERPSRVSAVLHGVLVALGSPATGPCMRQTLCPRTAGDRHGFPLRLDLARHLDARCMGNSLRFMRLILSRPSAGRRPTAHENSSRRRLELSCKLSTAPRPPGPTMARLRGFQIRVGSQRHLNAAVRLPVRGQTNHHRRPPNGWGVVSSWIQ